MSEVSVGAVRKQLASGALAPLYVLVGDDEAEKSSLAAAFAETVDEGMRAFNVDRLYGGETDVDRLIACADTLPMMADRRVVIVLEAEKLLVPKRESQAAEEAQERLERFIGAPPPHAAVVFVCGSLDQRRRLVKRLLQEAQVVACESLVSRAEAEQWLKVQAARMGVTLDPGAVRALVAQTGGSSGECDMVRLRAGFDRVTLYAMGEPTITADDVREVVPAAPEAQANFGIADAIRVGDARSALKQLQLALDGGAVPVFLLGQIRYAAEQVPAPRIPEAVEAVLRTDLALKSGRSTGPEAQMLLERLVVELCGDRRGAPQPVSRPRPSHSRR